MLVKDEARGERSLSNLRSWRQTGGFASHSSLRVPRGKRRRRKESTRAARPEEPRAAPSSQSPISETPQLDCADSSPPPVAPTALRRPRPAGRRAAPACRERAWHKTEEEERSRAQPCVKVSSGHLRAQDGNVFNHLSR